MGSTEETDNLIIACIAKYSECERTEYKVTDWPDKRKDSRNVPEIDAIAEANEKTPIAIEHTTLESFNGQLMDDSQIERICRAMEASIRPHIPSGIVAIIPILAFVKGFDWEKARKAIEEYLVNNAARLPMRASVHTIPDVPFPLTCFRRPSAGLSFYFARSSPSREQVALELTASVEKALQHKRARLKDYQGHGHRTLLIIESSDLALIGHDDVYKAFLRAERSVGVAHLSDVMYVNTGNAPNNYFHGFRGPEPLLECLNPPNFKLGPKYFAEWEPHL